MVQCKFEHTYYYIQNKLQGLLRNRRSNNHNFKVKRKKSELGSWRECRRRAGNDREAGETTMPHITPSLDSVRATPHG